MLHFSFFLQFFQDNNITHVVSVCGASPRLSQPHVHVLEITVDDDPSANLLAQFPKAVRFIHEGRLQGGSVYVHCAGE